MPGVEDCLILDVYVPQTPRSASLPVLVEIHGGGYATGYTTYYDGHSLVQHAAGAMIYVSIQYRLGPYGWLAAKDVVADGTANAGLLDQRLALEWVSNHISAFGGDPNQITISGGSAGGGSVTAQLTMYNATLPKIFRAAIAEYPWWQPYHDPNVYEQQYAQLLNVTNCSNLTCLRAVPEGALRTAAEQTYYYGYKPALLFGYGDFYYGPALDGTILPNLPSTAFSSGAFTPVPLLVNRDGYEGVVFSNSSLTTQAEETADLQLLYPLADANFFEELYQHYPASDFNSTFYQRSQIFGDSFVDCGTMTMALKMSQRSQPVWKMLFDAGSKLHGATEGFLFGANESVAQGNNATLAAIMKDWFVSFVVHNDPNAESWTNVTKPAWPTYMQNQTSTPAIIDVEVGSIGVSGDPDYSANCMWWTQQFNVTSNSPIQPLRT